MKRFLWQTGFLVLCMLLQGQSLPFPGPGTVHSVSGGAAPTVTLSSVGQDNSGNSLASLATSAGATTTGWTAFVVAMTSDNTVTHTAPTDTAGNTYTQLTTPAFSHADYGKFSMWRKVNMTGNAANVVTCHWGSSAFDACLVAYIANANTTDSVDVQFTSTVQGDTTVTSNAFSTTAAQTVIIACMPTSSGSNTYSAPVIGGSAGTLITTGATNTGNIGCGWRAVSVAQTSITASLTSSGFCSNCSIGGAAFK